jgi:hypothetical protein
VRREHDLAGAVTPGLLEAQGKPTVGQFLQTVVGNRRSGEIATEMLEANAIVGAYPHVRVHIKSGDIRASLAYDCGLGIFTGAAQTQHAAASAWTRGDQPLHRRIGQMVKGQLLLLVFSRVLPQVACDLSAHGTCDVAKSTTKWRVVEQLGKNDDLVELTVSREARKQDPSLPATYLARAITYQVKGFRPQTVLTSMLDRGDFPAAEVASLYHERWELELGYGEIKTDMLDRLESIRCRSVAGVELELWGILLAYNLIRLEMEKTAHDFGDKPTRISFVTSLRISCDTWSWCALASPGALPTRLKTMRDLFTSLVLPERRTARRYPRAVKIKMSNFPRKCPSNP